jgi:hypothetical protein
MPFRKRITDLSLSTMTLQTIVKNNAVVEDQLLREHAFLPTKFFLEADHRQQPTK